MLAISANKHLVLNVYLKTLNSFYICKLACQAPICILYVYVCLSLSPLPHPSEICKSDNNRNI